MHEGTGGTDRAVFCAVEGLSAVSPVNSSTKEQQQQIIENNGRGMNKNELTGQLTVQCSTAQYSDSFT
jgi:hypothetical protein